MVCQTVASATQAIVEIPMNLAHHNKKKQRANQRNVDYMHNAGKEAAESTVFALLGSEEIPILNVPMSMSA